MHFEMGVMAGGEVLADVADLQATTDRERQHIFQELAATFALSVLQLRLRYRTGAMIAPIRGDRFVSVIEYSIGQVLQWKSLFLRTQDLDASSLDRS